MFCIRVPKRDGERVRTDLISKGILDIGRKIGSEGDFLLIPILADSYDGYELIDAELERLEQAPTDYKEALEIPDDLRDMLPTSFDIIGDVAIIKLQEELLPYKHQIGEAMMSVNPALRLIVMDSGVKGDLRIRELEKIAGKGNSETIHKEFGVRMATDPSKVYFNPRLATERSRVASLVKDDEVIIDMFAGVAPFGLVICKRARPRIVYSIDLNSDAESFVKKNMLLNHIDNMVPITGDASIVIKDLPDADRIIMNLPQISDKFLIDALSHLKKGGIIHLHKIIERAELDELKEKMIEDAESHGFKIKIDDVSELKTYSPSMSVYVLDIIKC